MNKRVPFTEQDEDAIDSVFHWRRKYNEAVDKWIRLDSLLLRIMRENDALKAAVAEEREACAKVAEAYEPLCDTCPSGVANAIRARGEV
jgi:hypothetical protein